MWQSDTGVLAKFWDEPSTIQAPNRGWGWMVQDGMRVKCILRGRFYGSKKIGGLLGKLVFMVHEICLIFGRVTKNRDNS